MLEQLSLKDDFSPSYLTHQWVNFGLSRPSALLADLGCGQGLATLLAIKAGIKVLAVDVRSQAVQNLEACALSLGAFDKLSTQVGLFPDEFLLDDESLDGVLIANLLHFCDGALIMAMLKRIYRALKPDGVLFCEAATPYQPHFPDSILSEYHRRKEAGELWPGYCQDAREIGLVYTQESAFPVHALDDEILMRACRDAGFGIRACWYHSRDADLPIFQTGQVHRTVVHVISEKGWS